MRGYITISVPINVFVDGHPYDNNVKTRTHRKQLVDNNILNEHLYFLARDLCSQQPSLL